MVTVQASVNWCQSQSQSRISAPLWARPWGWGWAQPWVQIWARGPMARQSLRAAGFLARQPVTQSRPQQPPATAPPRTEPQCVTYFCASYQQAFCSFHVISLAQGDGRRRGGTGPFGNFIRHIHLKILGWHRPPQIISHAKHPCQTQSYPQQGTKIASNFPTSTHLPCPNSYALFHCHAAKTLSYAIVSV